MSTPRTFVLLAAAWLAGGCSLFGRAEEAGPLEQLPVVADDQPFDPAQAVDDDDDLERPWRGRTAQDQDAFAAADRDARTGRDATARRSDAADAAEASARSGDRGDTADSARAAAKVAAKRPPDEHVPSPQEVEALRAGRRREVSAADSAPDGDAAAKARVARNPPAEPLGQAKPTAWTVRDYALEGVLLAVLAAGVTMLIALARRAPKTSLAIALAIVAFIAGVFVTQGE
jgi:hypothetical protein